MGRFSMTVLLFIAALSGSLAAGQIVTAIRVDKGPSLDGSLADDVWKLAVAFTDFKMVDPTPGGIPSEKTELRIVYDHDNLYLGLMCFDREISRLSANSMVHDGGGDYGWEGEDIVRILLDPFQDKRNAYVFFVNPRGARSDGLAFGENFSLNWDGIWEAKSRILENGWSVEIRIPFKTISFNPRLTSWRLNVEREIPRKMEKIRLSGTGLDNFFFNPQEAAQLEGIADVKQGIGFTFRPYGIIRAQTDHGEPAPVGWKVDGGFDLYKNITPNFVGAFSYNTDFAETEVDERRINLTRFPLFFPEKRAFFLEGSDIFNFGNSGNQSFVPFFSRRIGLYDGQQVPIAFGVKMFGKVGNTSIALLDVKTRPTAGLGLSGDNFIAARVYQNIFAQSKVGLIFTSGNPSGKGGNSLAGVDFTYSSSRFFGDKNFTAIAWAVYNWNERKQGSHQGYGLKIDYPNDLWDVAATYNYFGDALEPGLGFLERNGVKSFTLSAGFMPRPEKGTIGRMVRQFYFSVSPYLYWNLNGALETADVSIVPFSFVTESGEHIEFSLSPTRDVLPYDFEVSSGVVIPAGAYNFAKYQIEFNSAAHRPVVFDLDYGFGDFYSGDYRDLDVGLTFKYRGYATLGLNANFVRGNLPQGRFSENVYQIKADFFFSPDLGLMNYIQYDDISRKLGANIRFRWQISPGNEIYLVYNKNWERRWNPVSRFIPLQDRGVCKIQVSIRP